MNTYKSSIMNIMARRFFILVLVTAVTISANAASVRGVSSASRTGGATIQNQTDSPTASYTYNYMYPYLNNQMRTTLKPADATSPTTSPINAVVRTEQLSAPRRVVARSAKSSVPTTTTTPARRVVARSGTQSARNVAPRRGQTIATTDSTRLENTYKYRSAENAAALPDTTPTISSARCLADYTECMNMYCVRENTQYNRCYCSSKLSQIDATYQPAIENLIKQILQIRNDGEWSDEEMNEYWMSTIGKYTGDNSWTNIDNLLDIDWSSMESRVRGQNAFMTGHEYCVQHLRGCFYMASNLRDAYRSMINTDCATYESSLQKLKNAAESVLGAYQE